MTTWQEPRSGTQPARIVRLLRRPDGATFKEIATALKVKNTNARAYLSSLRIGGCPVQEREEEGRGRVFYLIKIDRRRKVQAAPEPSPSGAPFETEGPTKGVRNLANKILVDFDDRALRRYPDVTARVFLLSAAEAVLENPMLALEIQNRIMAKYA